MPDDGYLSDLARELAPDALERFLRYVRIDTRSDPHSTTYPSTGKQFDLLRLLADECREAGLADVALDEHGYVTATDSRDGRPERSRRSGSPPTSTRIPA